MNRFRLGAAALLCAVSILGVGSAIADASTPRTPSVRFTGGKKIDLAGYSFVTTYPAGPGFDAGSTYTEHYTAKSTTWTAVAGPDKGFVGTHISYTAISLGHNLLEILATFPTGMPAPYPNGLDTVLLFDLNTHSVRSSVTDGVKVPWSSTIGTVRVTHVGSHRVL